MCTDIPRMHLPNLLTLPAANGEEEDEADEQKEEDLDEAIESHYARKYSLAEFIEGGDGDNDDEAVLQAGDESPPKLTGGVSPSRGLRMRSPADMSFVGSIARLAGM